MQVGPMDIMHMSVTPEQVGPELMNAQVAMCVTRCKEA